MESGRSQPAQACHLLPITDSGMLDEATLMEELRVEYLRDSLVPTKFTRPLLRPLYGGTFSRRRPRLFRVIVRDGITPETGISVPRQRDIRSTRDHPSWWRARPPERPRPY